MSTHTAQREGDAPQLVHRGFKVGDRVVSTSPHGTAGERGTVTHVEYAEPLNGGGLTGRLVVSVTLDNSPVRLAFIADGDDPLHLEPEVQAWPGDDPASPVDGAPATEPAPSTGTTERCTCFGCRRRPAPDTTSPTHVPTLVEQRPTLVAVPTETHARRIIRGADIDIDVFDAELRAARAIAAAPALAALDLADAVATFLEGWDAGADSPALDDLVRDLRTARLAWLAVTR